MDDELNQKYDARWGLMQSDWVNKASHDPNAACDSLVAPVIHFLDIIVGPV